MLSLEELQKQIEEIKLRNKRVEAEKAWETSATRRLLILVLTYFVVVLFFIFAKLPDPFANAVVPSLAFVISTISVPVIKKWWVKKFLN